MNRKNEQVDYVFADALGKLLHECYDGFDESSTVYLACRDIEVALRAPTNLSRAVESAGKYTSGSDRCLVESVVFLIEDIYDEAEASEASRIVDEFCTAVADTTIGKQVIDTGVLLGH